MITADAVKPEKPQKDVQELVVMKHKSEISQLKEDSKVFIKKEVMSQNDFQYISKTLTGLMEMDSIQKRLEGKNLIVKLVEKTYDSVAEAYKKNVSYLYGYMSLFCEEEGDKPAERWAFSLINDENGAVVLNSQSDDADLHECNGNSEEDDEPDGEDNIRKTGISSDSKQLNAR